MGSSIGRPVESHIWGCHPSRKTGVYGGTDTLRCELLKEWKRILLDQHEPLLNHNVHTHIYKHTDRDVIQLDPKEVQSSFSCSVRCSWRSEIAPLVIAGLTTEAPNAGPPVVFTIWWRKVSTVIITETEKLLNETLGGLTSLRGTKTWCSSSGASGCEMDDLRRCWKKSKQSD